MTQQNHTSPKEIEQGDELVLLVRKTPMEVVEVRDHPTAVATVVAKNQHGRYRLRYQTDGTWALWVSAELEAAGQELDVQINKR